MAMRDADDLMRRHFDHASAGYDDWWLGTGRFAERDRPGWSAEVEQLIGVLQSLPPGTGARRRLWHGLSHPAFSWSGSGTRPERSDGRDRCGPHADARVVQGDIAPLPFDEGEFDRVFTSHFFHHLAADRRAAFLVEARRVGHEIVVVEDVRQPGRAQRAWRQVELGDGSHHRMHRHAFTAAELSVELGDGQVLHEGRWFVVVAATLMAEGAQARPSSRAVAVSGSRRSIVVTVDEPSAAAPTLRRSSRRCSPRLWTRS